MKVITTLNTTPQTYLTGISALNIANEEYTGDWHFYNCFLIDNPNYFIEHVPDTPWQSSNDDIIEVSAILQRYGATTPAKVYAADHYRAIADLFLDGKNKSADCRYLFFSVDDWLNTWEQKLKLFKYLEILDDSTINSWMDEQRKSEQQSSH